MRKRDVSSDRGEVVWSVDGPTIFSDVEEVTSHTISATWASNLQACETLPQPFTSCPSLQERRNFRKRTAAVQKSEIMGSTLPCKYGRRNIGYKTPYSFCNIPVCSATWDSYADEPCASRCCWCRKVSYNSTFLNILDSESNTIRCRHRSQLTSTIDISPLKPAELQVLRAQYEKEGEHVGVQTKFNFAWVSALSPTHLKALLTFIRA